MDTQNEPEIRCPYCHEEIDRLSYICTATHYYDAYISNGSIEYEEQDINYWDGYEHDFRCPLCDELIADNEADAEEFLKTGNIPSEGDEALASQEARPQEKEAIA